INGLREGRGKIEAKKQGRESGKSPVIGSFPLCLPSAFPSAFPPSSLEPKQAQGSQREERGKNEGRESGESPARTSFPLCLPSAFPSGFPPSSLEFCKPPHVADGFIFCVNCATMRA